MEISFKGLTFEVREEIIFLKSINGFEGKTQTSFVEVQVSGENKDTHLGSKSVNTSESGSFKYVSHKYLNNKLEIIQKSELVEVKTVFIAYEDAKTVRIFTEIKNISDSEITLEEVSAICVLCIGEIQQSNDLFFTRFTQSHHFECQPISRSFNDYGLNLTNGNAQKAIRFCNVGSWSTKEELPQGII